MILTYSETFKRQLKRLSRKYRRIRSDIEPILKRLDAGQVMGDQIPGARHPLYKVPPIATLSGARVVATASSTSLSPTPRSYC